MKHLRVIGYTRVSTEEQASGGFSLDAQAAKIRAYCELYELELARIESDPGFSGKDLERPGVSAVLAELRRRKNGDAVDGLVVAKLDRLTRSLRDWQALIEEHFDERRGKRLFSVEESIDTRRASGRLVLNVIMTVAQWEREVIGERTRDALQAKIARGERCGKVRFGHDLAGDGRSLVENAREQEAIRLMEGWRAEGKSLRAMCRLLEEMGIETKEGGRVWLPMTIKRILSRPVA
jgi:DNA invertase Pin-like site-specific DNA recombinase